MGFEPGATWWDAQTNPLSYGDTRHIKHIFCNEKQSGKAKKPFQKNRFQLFASNFFHFLGFIRLAGTEEDTALTPFGFDDKLKLSRRPRQSYWAPTIVIYDSRVPSNNKQFSSKYNYRFLIYAPRGLLKDWAWFCCSGTEVP